MTYPVKWFHSRMTGAPSVTSALNAIIDILDACLINGFSTQPLASLTYDSGEGECTATVSAGHGFEDLQIVLVSGADQSEYNGEVRIGFVDAITFTYVPSSTPGVATATGTISAKSAPIGSWSKPFSDTNRAAYHSSDALYSGNYLFVDDNTGIDGATVKGYNNMIGIDAGTDEFGSGYWRKKDATNTIIDWFLIGDARGFYFGIGRDPSIDRSIFAFGDVVSFVPGDGLGCCMSYDTTATGGTMNTYGCISNYNSIPGHVISPDHALVGITANFEPRGRSDTGTYPDSISGGHVINGRVMLYEQGIYGHRGYLAGVHCLLTPSHMVPIIIGNNIFISAKGDNHIAFDISDAGWR